MTKALSQILKISDIYSLKSRPPSLLLIYEWTSGLLCLSNLIILVYYIIISSSCYYDNIAPGEMTAELCWACWDRTSSRGVKVPRRLVQTWWQCLHSSYIVIAHRKRSLKPPKNSPTSKPPPLTEQDVNTVSIRDEFYEILAVRFEITSSMFYNHEFKTLQHFFVCGGPMKSAQVWL